MQKTLLDIDDGKRGAKDKNWRGEGGGGEEEDDAHLDQEVA